VHYLTCANNTITHTVTHERELDASCRSTEEEGSQCPVPSNESKEHVQPGPSSPLQDENGRNFSVPFRSVFYIFSSVFVLRDPVFVFAEVENGVFRSFPSNLVLIRNRPVFISFLSRFQSMLNMFNNYMSLLDYVILI
jgi:hypothetical protein